jgi:hypothetical protein
MGSSGCVLRTAFASLRRTTQGPLESKSSRVKSFSTCFVRRQAGGEIESDDSDEYQTPSERGDIYKFGYSEIPLVNFKAALRYVREAAYSGTA